MGYKQKEYSRIKAVTAAFIFFVLTAGQASAGGPEQSLAGWYLVWNDEFEAQSLDQSKWRVEDAALVKNNELQYYSPESVFVRDGNLVLRSEKRQMKDRRYVSGLVETKGRFAFQYGRVEIRARLPQGKGLWPAHWMLPQSGKWPPEIDIMELIGHSPNTVHMTLHWGKWPENKYKGKIFTGPDFSADYHVFALEWEPEGLDWYVDGVNRFSMNENIPQEPFYLILNTAVGGSWPGAPNSATVFPQEHEIDYVRVYAREMPGTYFLTASAENGTVVLTPQKPRYEQGEVIAMTMMPKIGYEFQGWSGDISGNSNPAQVVMDAHKRVNGRCVLQENPPQLLSRGRPVTASSQEADDLTAGNAADALMDTRWSSLFSDPQWICVDLGRTCAITAVRLRWETAYARRYELQVSDDSKEWRTVYTQDNGIGRDEEIYLEGVKARYVQLYCVERATEYGYSLWEFEVFGEAAE